MFGPRDPRQDQPGNPHLRDQGAQVEREIRDSDASHESAVLFAAFVGLAERDVTADRDGVAAVAVLGDQDPVAAFLHGVFAGHVHGGIEVVFNGVGVVGGDFQDEVRVALDHCGLFLGVIA